MVKMLLVVIAVLLAAILGFGWWMFGEPRVTRERIEKNEAEALACMMAIGNGAARYEEKFGKYPESLAALARSGVEASWRGYRAGAELATGKYGYHFNYYCTRADVRRGGVFLPSQPCAGFAVVATPLQDGRSGRRRFFRDDTGVIRVAVGENPGPYSDPIR